MYTNISVKLIVEYFDLFWAMRRLDKRLPKADELTKTKSNQDVSFVMWTHNSSTYSLREHPVFSAQVSSSPAEKNRRFFSAGETRNLSRKNRMLSQAMGKVTV